ncbi:E3 ubiquitin/ISG15 ligase TRIM25-like [Rhinophrynus dorsalis]
MASSDLRAELNCSICLNLYTDPVTLGCGHNFCQVCIGDVLDTQERCGVYSCPECRAEYQERPALQRNRKLCNIVERFLSTHPEQEETTIFCTYCIHSPVPAVKSCLHCEASLCDKHLRVHNKSVEHVITEPTASLGTRKCSLHSEILKYYCTEDAICICVSCCLIGEHKGHKVGSLNESAERKKEKLRNVLENLISKREEAKKRVQSLQEHRKHVQGKSAALAERVTDLIREQLEALEKRVLSEISRQVEQVSLQVSDLIQQLEIKKDELSGKIRLIEKLCKVTDPFTVLQEQESDRAEDSDTEEGDDKDTERDYTNVPPVGDLDEVLISLTLHTGLADIVTTVKSEKGFCMKETTDMLLDVNTAGNCLTLSGDLKTASWTETNQSYPKTPGRFMNYPQVLSLKSLSSGRHYWEIETSESGVMRIGVAYPSIDRKGHLSLVGFNKKSWCLHMRSHHTYSVVHDSKESLLTPELSCKRLGIYLDYEAGRLSFYELSDPIRHLHTFTATFTEPLHTAFWVWKDWVRIRLRN